MAAGTVAAADRALHDACSVTPAGPGDVVDGVPARWVARPASTDEVAAAVSAAAAHGLSLVPRGRGTKLGWGRPPDSVDVLLDLARLDRVVDHEAGDLIVEAQAGTTLRDVQAVVGRSRQRLAVDETVPGASLGGTIATATSGPGRLAHGTVRDLLLGVRFVRADGTIAKAGGRVVKNVAGYDLAKVMAGSYGTLAVITQAVFRLHPVPEARGLVSARVRGPAEAAVLGRAVLRSGTAPAAVEVSWDSGVTTVQVLLEGTRAGVAARTEQVRSLAGREVSVSEALPEDWGHLPWSSGRPDAALKMTCALSGVADLLTAVERCGAAIGVRGSLGTGVLYGAVEAGGHLPAVSGAVDALRATCRAYGGSLVVLDAPPAIKSAIDTWGPVTGLPLMRRLKEQFDPASRLSPSRFVGGI